ncbi:hypothetical protein BCR35DRAFT_303517 [Leucosporidium creatinivorum]|uniref:Uncharacterized protein n=1 Tax=Leucosporidium creatinivorum TaxID=106004 RepID=A0A1Y2FJB3_9BASI|nr:hypothetical protein BCR35DRAFT_303517 [Leucosporidium creatinivorum]
MVSPFSCFSPSYHETLPPRHSSQQTQGRPSIPQFSTNGLPAAPPSPNAYQRTRGKSVDFAAGSRQQGGGATGLSAKASRRRSAGPDGGKRISKDLIGAPTNFTHVGGHGAPAAAGGPQSAETDRSLAAIRAAMEGSSPPVAPNPVPSVSPSSTSLPLTDHTNSRPITPSSRPLSPSPKPPNPTANARQRKPPPPVTASVIRQAGPEAVAASQRPTSPVPTLPPGFATTPLPSSHPLLDQSRQAEPREVGATEEKETEKEAETEAPKQQQQQALYDEQGRLLQRDPAGGYMTATAKGRFDVGMKALEDALRLD